MRINIKPPLGTPINRSHPLSQGLLALWLLNEGGGNIILNATGVNYNGSLVASPTWGTGFNGSIISLNGSTQYIDTKNITLPIGKFSVGAWCLKTSAGTSMVLSQNNGTFTEYTFYLRPGSNSGFTAGASNFQFTTSADISSNVWHHVFLTYDGATLVYYIDGVLSNQAGVSGTPSNPGSTTKIGTDTNQFWPGSISVAWIYGRALSHTEVQQLYTNTNSIFQNYYIAQSSQLFHYKLNNSGIRPRPFAPGIAR